MTEQRLLSVRNLSLTVTGSGVEVVKKVGFDIEPGEIFGIVGESGSGKSLATRALISLLPPAIKVTGGEVTYKGRDVMSMSEADLRRLRGAEIGLVFQEPMTSLNPSMTIGRQLEEGLALHTNARAAERRDRILAMLERVGIRDPDAALSAYPHEFSGGMRQRIMLASVMLLKPALLIADEPTTALDAVVQRDVMELMVELTKAEGTAVLLISHDLPMVARYTSRIVVMEKGAVVEQGTTAQILETPQHPYTRKLLSSLPIRGKVRSIPAANRFSRRVSRNGRSMVSASIFMPVKSSPWSAGLGRERRRSGAPSPDWSIRAQVKCCFRGGSVRRIGATTG